MDGIDGQGRQAEDTGTGSIKCEWDHHLKGYSQPSSGKMGTLGTTDKMMGGLGISYTDKYNTCQRSGKEGERVKRFPPGEDVSNRI